ncbi:hypothetical protein PILCRDRAFT_10737 [Piloderma croceum F 1598]|uniref:VWFA domain-containing protein n=1 Tax=Piloderma croceum (strain F 1598) TaxID=765440 RepID=A0A0C3FGV3_PILCF|nr:hypothetical protein PILCRDRAFT_10737 [Piloderma croceum F 1598]
MSNEVPQLFDWDQVRNQPGDRWARDELNHSTVEFVAPTEYMVRAPQPAVYVILIDVSHTAIQSGMVATATRTILENLDRIPNEDNRTKIAITCFDISLYFFSMPPGTIESTMLVVSDTDDVFLPKPTDLVLSKDAKILGTLKESNLLQAASPFYKKFAIECSRAQVSVDMFLFSSAYQDVASLGNYLLINVGQTYFYPAFDAARSEDAIKFAHEFGEVLVMPIMLEAVQRVRASKGLRMASFHGNFLVRSTDFLAMPAVPQDQSYAIEIQIEDTITAPFVMFQVAVLHTTCYGERRIRVINLALPTTRNLSELYASADQVAIATLLTNKAVERCITHSLENSREAVFAKLVEIFSAFKAGMTAAGTGASAQLSISENLKMLPVLILGLFCFVLENVGIRQKTIESRTSTKAERRAGEIVPDFAIKLRATWDNVWIRHASVPLLAEVKPAGRWSLTKVPFLKSTMIYMKLAQYDLFVQVAIMNRQTVVDRVVPTLADELAPEADWENDGTESNEGLSDDDEGPEELFEDDPDAFDLVNKPDGFEEAWESSLNPRRMRRPRTCIWDRSLPRRIWQSQGTHGRNCSVLIQEH